MATVPSTGMNKAEMKQLLMKATPENPISFAFAVGKEPGLALLKMDKIKSPKACLKMLADEFEESKTPGWGTVTVDEGLVKFSVNKAVSGIARRLTKTLKGTGFRKVEILLEDGSVVDGASEEEEDQAADDTPGVLAQAGAAEPERQDGAALEALRTSLANLIKQIPAISAANPGAKDGLMKLATAANGALKTGKLPEAAAMIKALEQQVGAALAQATTAAATPDAAALLRDLAELVKRIPAAIAADPASKAGLVQAATAANTALKAHDPVAAGPTAAGPTAAGLAIEALRRMLDAGTEAAEDGQAAGERTRERLTDLQMQIAFLTGPEKSELQGRVRQLLGAMDQTDPAKLATQMEALEADLAKAAGAARVAGAASAAGRTVSFRKLQFEWRDAQVRARKQLDAFVAAVLGDKAVQGHAQFDEIKEAAGQIGKQMPEFGNDIEKALCKIDDAKGDTERATARVSAQGMLADYADMLEDADGLNALQSLSDDEYGGISFVGELQTSLRSLEAHLADAS